MTINIPDWIIAFIKALVALLSQPTPKKPIDRKEPRLDNSMRREAGDE